MNNYVYCLMLCAFTAVLRLSNSASTSESNSVKPTATTGIVIDAGSGGSRLHIYTWKPRVFSSYPPKISYPESNEKWTARIGPGVAMFGDNLDGIYGHLKPLMDFAVSALSAEEKIFGQIPIYFYATGGVRLLTTKKRDAVIDTVRDLFKNDSFCPFFFKRSFARVISGEEEAIFSWAATNFLMGTLLPASEGEGVVQNVNSTYGTVDLGGASTQIAYFLPSQDILEGLYKFQIGNQKIWNVYTKSFLSFGVVSARQRHIAELVDAYLAELPKHSYDKHTTGLRTVNSCFYAGYSEQARDESGKIRVEVAGPELPQADQLHRCMDLLRPLMEKKHNAFCEAVYHGDCAIAGSYQPPLPNGEHGKFIGTSSLVMPWKFLQLPATASLELIKARASAICQMNFDDIMFYYEVNFSGDVASAVTDALPYFCFLSSYVIVLLEDGYSFKKNQTLTVMEQVNGNRMGWALGAILYEINGFPWALQNPGGDASLLAGGEHSWWMFALAALVGFVIGGIAAVLVYREVTQHPYRRLPGAEDIESDTYDNIRRASTVEMLRRRPDHSSGADGATSGALTGTGTGSAYSTGSTVGRHERYDGGGYEADRGLVPTAGPGTPTAGGKQGYGTYQQGNSDNL